MINYNLNVSWLPEADIESAAQKFHFQYNLTELPIDIERVIESDLGINIIPQPGLRQLANTEGFITTDFSAIYIENEVYENYYPRYRFTLAHEIGHYVLHRHYFSELNILNLEDWLDFNENMSSSDNGRLEYQGYAFGGYLLVPTDSLETEYVYQFELERPKIIEAISGGLGQSVYKENVIDDIANRLTSVFEVSSEVLTRRINKLNLFEKYHKF
ncbi:ImmA/IrrE family metallo-endopeptidase [candidate division KSB1 bacterium]|nr:ImmA/IrrE family metallo-endopeptidase [candidate division KSB1 bacterium]